MKLRTILFVEHASNQKANAFKTSCNSYLNCIGTSLQGWWQVIVKLPAGPSKTREIYRIDPKSDPQWIDDGWTHARTIWGQQLFRNHRKGLPLQITICCPQPLFCVRYTIWCAQAPIGACACRIRVRRGTNKCAPMGFIKSTSLIRIKKGGPLELTTSPFFNTCRKRRPLDFTPKNGPKSMCHWNSQNLSVLRILTKWTIGIHNPSLFDACQKSVPLEFTKSSA